MLSVKLTINLKAHSMPKEEKNGKMSADPVFVGDYEELRGEHANLKPIQKL
mgnify:CR=1 FL=1